MSKAAGVLRANPNPPEAAQALPELLGNIADNLKKRAIGFGRGHSAGYLIRSDAASMSRNSDLACCKL
jgi:hypothetical protein